MGETDGDGHPRTNLGHSSVWGGSNACPTFSSATVSSNLVFLGAQSPPPFWVCIVWGSPLGGDNTNLPFLLLSNDSLPPDQYCWAQHAVGRVLPQFIYDSFVVACQRSWAQQLFLNTHDQTTTVFDAIALTAALLALTFSPRLDSRC